MDTSSIKFKAQHLYLIVGDKDRILIAKLPDGRPVYLSPGNWTLKVKAELSEINDPSQPQLAYRRRESETGAIAELRGRRWGREPSTDYYGPSFIGFPIGGWISGIVDNVVQFFPRIAQRPNLHFSSQTTLFFNVYNVTATLTAPAQVGQ